jgi:hypothetical protein
MANRHAIRRKTRGAKPVAPKKTVSIGKLTGSADGTASPPANDNGDMLQLPACLPVTDEEVRLLHRYLSREILGLFS